MHNYRRRTRTHSPQGRPFPRPGGPLLRTSLEALEARRVLSSPAANQAPVIEAIADQLAAPGAEFALQVIAHDAETPAERLTFSLAPGSSPHAQIDASTGLLRFATPASEGIESVIVVVTDDGSPQQSATVRFDVVVSSVGFAGLSDVPVGAVPPNLPPADVQSASVLLQAPPASESQAAADSNLGTLPALDSPLADTGVPHISESMEVASRARVTVNRPEIPEPDGPQPPQEPESSPPAAPEDQTPPSPGSPEEVPQEGRPAAVTTSLTQAKPACEGAGHVLCEQAEAKRPAELAATEGSMDGAGKAHLPGRAYADEDSGTVIDKLSATVAEDRGLAPAEVFADADEPIVWRHEAAAAAIWATPQEERHSPPEAILQSALLLACAPLRRSAVPLGPAQGRRLGRFERLARA